MNGWIILGAVLLVLFLVCQIRVGGQAEYSDKGFVVWVRISSFQMQVFPLKKKDKTAKKKKPKKVKRGKSETKSSGTASPETGGKAGKKDEKRDVPLTEKIGGALDYAQNLLPIGLEAISHLFQKIQMDTLKLELTIGAADPADAAMAYGQASAALGALWYPLTQAFHVRDGSAQVRVDFEAQTMTVYGIATLTIKIGQILWLGVYFGLRALRKFLAVRKSQKSKETGKAV